MNRATELQKRPRHRGSSVGRIRDAIVRRKHAASPSASGRASSLARLVGVQHVRGDTDRTSEIAPSRPTCQLFLAVAKVKQSTSLEAGVLAGLHGEALPEIETLRGHRQLAGIAILLATPAPVAARLLGADAALLDKRDFHAALGEVVGGESTDDATADDHGIGGLRQVRARLDMRQQ